MLISHAETPEMPDGLTESPGLSVNTQYVQKKIEKKHGHAFIWDAHSCPAVAAFTIYPDVNTRCGVV